jgi:hypothetical protein
MTCPLPNDLALIGVYDGRICIGFLYRRGKDGVEAYDTNTVSLGTYPCIDDAAAAVWRRARGQWIDWPTDGAAA